MWKKLTCLAVALMMFLTSMPLAWAGSLVDDLMEEIEAIQKALDEGLLSEEEALELLWLLEDEDKAALPTPQNVRATVASYNSVTLSWDAVAGATYYNVHRSMSATGPFTIIQSNVTTTTFTDTQDLVCGSTYYYRVVARNGLGDSSSFSAIVPIAVTPDVPTLLSATVTTPTTVELTWTESQGATGYYIYRAETTTGSYSLLAAINNAATTSYTDTTVTTGVTYSYRMQSYTGSVTSDYSNVLSVVALPATPTNVKVVSSAYNALTVTWDAVPGAAKYIVQRSNTATGNYITVGETTATSFVETGVQTGVEYYYRVAAVVNNVQSDFSVPASDYPRAEPVTGLTATATSDTTVRLSWSLKLNAGYSAYKIEIATLPDGPFTAPYPLVEGENTTTLDISGLTTGQTYYFRVRGVTRVTMSDGTLHEVDGDPSNQVSVIPKPSTPENLTVENAGRTSLKISWDAVASADGYELYRSLNYDSGFMLTADITATPNVARETYTDLNLTCGVTYYYRLVAYVFNAGVKVYSGYTGIVSGMPAPLAPATFNVAVTSFQSVVLTWSAVQGAEGYDILMAEGSSDAFDTVATAGPNDTSYGINNLKIGVTYYFMVRAYVTVNGVHVPGTPTDVKTAIIMPGAVIWDACAPSTISIDYLKWQPVPGATGYEVEWSEDGVNFTLATTVTTNEAYIAIEPGKIMYFRVRAYVTTDKNYYGDYSTVFGFTPQPATPVISSVQPMDMQHLLVSWATSTDIAGMDGGYLLYVGSSPNTASMTLLATLNRTDINYYNHTVTPGVTYYYALKSYVHTDYGRRESDFSVVMGGYTRPAAPGNLVVYGNDASSFVMSWTMGDANAEAYEVFVATNEAGPYTEVGYTTYLQYVTPNVFSFGTVYFFKVRSRISITDLSGTRMVYSDYSNVVAATPSLAAPTNVQVTIKSNTSVVVSWEAVKDASGYYVYMSTVSGGNASRVATVNSTTLQATISKLNVGQTYYFRVAAYYTYKKQQYEGARSSEVSTITSLTAPIVNYVHKDKSSLVLSWNAVSGATSYRIYQKLHGSADDPALIADGVTGTSYTVSGLPTGVWYIYYVVPCTKLNGETVEGTWSTGTVAAALLPAPASINVTHGANTEAIVTWSRVPDATGYILYASDQSDPTTFTQQLKMESGDTLNAIVDTAAIGFTTTAYFRVAAYYRDPVSMQEIEGMRSAIVSLDTVPEAPSWFTAEQIDVGKVRLRWNPVDNVNGYYLFMKGPTDTAFQVIGQVGNTVVYDVTGLSADTNYEFAIRAYRITGTSFVFGKYASTSIFVNITPIPLSAPVLVSVTQGASYSAIVTWQKVDNATGYRVYMSKNAGPYDLVTTVNGINKLTATIPNLEIGATYDFFIRAFATNSSGSQEGPMSNIGTIVISGPSSLPAPIGLSVSQTGDTEAKVIWDAVPGAIGYYVFTSEKDANHFKVAGTTTATEFDLKSLKKTSTYYVTVRAYTWYSGNVVYGDYPVPAVLTMNAAELSMVGVTYTVSTDGKSLLVTRPEVTGGTGEYHFTYYIWKDDGSSAGSLSSDAASVTLSPSPAVNGNYSVAVVVQDGISTISKQGTWVVLTGYATTPMQVETTITWTLSPDHKSIYITKPKITAGTGTGLKATYAYNLYNDASVAVNYFYSDENVVAVTPDVPGKYNVFIVVNDGVYEEVRNIGWVDIP